VSIKNGPKPNGFGPFSFVFWQLPNRQMRASSCTYSAHSEHFFKPAFWTTLAIGELTVAMGAARQFSSSATAPNTVLYFRGERPYRAALSV
jgi:hypothetical protein